jgi:hypothetical protein
MLPDATIVRLLVVYACNAFSIGEFNELFGVFLVHLDVLFSSNKKFSHAVKITPFRITVRCQPATAY